MSSKIATVLFVLLCAGQPALARTVAAPHPASARTQVAANDPADRATFDASVANLAVKAAFAPSSRLSRRDYLSLMILMSVPRARVGTHISEGAKP